MMQKYIYNIFDLPCDHVVKKSHDFVGIVDPS